MRKVLPILLAMAIAAPALADVTASVSDATGGVAQIDLAIDGGAIVRGVALKVTITGAELASIDDVVIVDPRFNAYIDYYYSNTGFLDGLADETELPGTGAHAVADPLAAGVLPSVPATEFVISVGALDNSGAQGGVDTSAVLAQITLSNFAGSTAQVCVEADALRGGIVGDTLGTVTDSACADVSAGGPACWNNPCQPYGDFNGDNLITATDVQGLLAVWGQPYSDPCPDFNHDGLITATDVQILLASWGVGCP